MSPNLLFPNYFKKIGFLLYILGYGYAINYDFNPDDVHHFQGLLIQLTILIGLLFISGSKEKIEDEMIQNLRLLSIKWAVFLMVLIRVFFKIIAFSTQNADFLPNKFQMNFLFILYLILFYYHLYVKDFITKLFNKNTKNEE